MNRSLWSKGIVAALATVALGACTLHGRARAFVEPVGTVEVRSAPVVDYRRYPQTVYEGRIVYWIDNRWGYPSGDRWVYFVTEPPPLARYRATIQTAPPAPRPPAPTHVRPAPAPERQAPPTSAPPATRVR
jgi:hypothetical protein